MRTLLLSCALLLGCIERPFDVPAPPPPRAAVERAALQGVLLAAIPADAIPVGAVFGNAAELVGFKSEPPSIVPGERMRVTLYWRCKAELEPWHVFVHLDDASGSDRIHAEHDPAGGRFPTDAWKPGDLIADSFTFVAGRSQLSLFLGLYSTGETRLALTAAGRGHDDGNNRLLAGALPLVTLAN